MARRLWARRGSVKPRDRGPRMTAFTEAPPACVENDEAQSHLEVDDVITGYTHLRRCVWALVALLAMTLTAPVEAAQKEGYSADEILHATEKFFGKTTEGLGKIVEKVFAEHGRPNAYVAGQEVSGAFGIGLRYGDGTLMRKGSGGLKVYWTGPSIGFDFGGNASKVFVLVYHLKSTDQIFQRFPAVDGSWYYVGGAGVNYQQLGDIILAPIRIGVGLRAGASIGYMHYTRTKTYNPF